MGYGNVKTQELNMEGKLSERKPRKTRLRVLLFLALDLFIFSELLKASEHPKEVEAVV